MALTPLLIGAWNLDSDFNGFQLNENGKLERKMFN